MFSLIIIIFVADIQDFAKPLSAIIINLYHDLIKQAMRGKSRVAVRST